MVPFLKHWRCSDICISSHNICISYGAPFCYIFYNYLKKKNNNKKHFKLSVGEKFKSWRRATLAGVIVMNISCSKIIFQERGCSPQRSSAKHMLWLKSRILQNSAQTHLTLHTNPQIHVTGKVPSIRPSYVLIPFYGYIYPLGHLRHILSQITQCSTLCLKDFSFLLQTAWSFIWFYVQLISAQKDPDQ